MSEQRTSRCSSCKRTKPISDFALRKGKYARKIGKEGQPYHYCRQCKAAYARRKGTSFRTYAQRSIAIARHRRRCLLTPDDWMDLWFSQGGRCALTGDDMTTIRGKGVVPTNASLDRIDPSRDYEPGNCRLVQLQVNILRGPLTIPALRLLCEKILKNTQVWYDDLQALSYDPSVSTPTEDSVHGLQAQGQ